MLLSGRIKAPRIHPLGTIFPGAVCECLRAWLCVCMGGGVVVCVYYPQAVLFCLEIKVTDYQLQHFG